LVQDYSWILTGIVSIALLFTLIIVLSPLASAQTPTQSTPQEFKVAFIADQGLSGYSDSSFAQQIKEKTRNTSAQPQKEYVPGQLIVTFKQESEISNIRAATTFEYRVANAIPEHEKMVKWQSVQNNMAVIKIDPAAEQQFMQMLKQNPNVKSVERDYLVYPRGHVTSSDPRFSSQAWQYNAINLIGAWHQTTGSPQIIIAVVDTGVDFANNDLAASFWANDDSCGGGVDDDGNGFVDDCMGWDFADNDNNPQDVDSHGTFVSGLMTAELNNGIDGAVFFR